MQTDQTPPGDDPVEGDPPGTGGNVKSGATSGETLRTPEENLGDPPGTGGEEGDPPGTGGEVQP
jgi:hypothetical protein